MKLRTHRPISEADTRARLEEIHSEARDWNGRCKSCIHYKDTTDNEGFCSHWDMVAQPYSIGCTPGRRTTQDLLKAK